VCKCVLYYCHRLTTQLQLTNISYHIKYRAADANRFHLLQDRDRWQTVLSTKMNPLVNFVYFFIFYSSDYTVHANPWTPLGSISRRIYPYLSFLSVLYPFSSDHFQPRPTISFSWLSNVSFPFWEILKHFHHSYFFWRSLHMS